MKARITAAAIAVGVLLGLTGCGMLTPVATNIQYNASDGSSANTGDIAIRNIMVITGDAATGTDSGSLVLTAINGGSADRSVTVQYDGKGGPQTVSIDVPAGQTLAIGIGENLPIPVSGIDTPAGGTIEMYVQSGDAEGQLVSVPVLDTRLIEYQHLSD